MKLTLRWPPSLNHYYRHVGRRTLISREGRAYREHVRRLLATQTCRDGNGPRKPPAGGRIALAMDAYPPDRRKRDLDNVQKALLDSLEKARVYEDDSQIDLLLTQRRIVDKPCGHMLVEIVPLPLQRCLLCGRPLVESEHRHDN